MRIIAHRGASAYAPENTLAAIDLSLRMGATEVEFDVHQTKDGRLAVIHDADLRRVAASRRRIGSMTLGELRSFDVGSWFGPGFAAERVPSLDDVLDLLRGRALAHVELKGGPRAYPGYVENVLRTLRARGALGASVVSSFNRVLLRSLRRHDPKVEIGVLTPFAIGSGYLRLAHELKAASLDVSHRRVSRRMVEAAHARGIKVLVYTVNDAAAAERLGAMGVDGVFTNHPNLLEMARVA